MLPAMQRTKPTPLPASCPLAVAKGLYEVSASPLHRLKIKPGLHAELGIQIYKSGAADQKQTHGKAKASQGREGTHPSTELPLSPSSPCPALSPSALAVGKPCLGGLLTQATGLLHSWPGLLATCEPSLQGPNEGASLNPQPKRTLGTEALRWGFHAFRSHCLPPPRLPGGPPCLRSALALRSDAKTSIQPGERQAW